ncbi:MAG TPA: hypothetical protein VLH39_08305, partial [Magnetospirillaceae bacterium]|nr:hypothetical protein [Magnetospirillaceae bacterium]
MKRLPAAVAVAYLAASTLSAQSAHFFQARTERYMVWAEAGQDRADRLAKTLEGLFTIFEEHMRFNPARLPSRLNVRAFRDRAGFDAHLTRVIGETRQDFVYLHYTAPGRSELVVFDRGEPEFSASLAHQAFVQYLKAFISNPPLWIQEGFAVYFERSAWDAAAGSVSFRENTAWLETLKALRNSGKLLSVEAILTAGPERAAASWDVFYPQSWALVSFLLDGRKPRYARFLWDSLSILEPEASLEDNQRAVAELFRRWHDSSTVQEDFLIWLDSRRTFAELVEDGVRFYAEKRMDLAEAAFLEALARNEGSCVPHYYLGLIFYGRNDFDLADHYYRL